MYVQYGCGFSPGKDWKNFDASLTLRWERIPVVGRMYTKNATRFPPEVMYGDIVKGLPVPPQSCRGVFASHVLEHLALSEFHQALDNTREILRDGGIFRVLVPDLEAAARSYIHSLETGNSTANNSFLEETSLGKKDRKRGLRFAIHNWLNTSAHLWMWDDASLSEALKKHGFNKIRRCSFGDCDDAMFARVEREDRFHNAVALEAY